MGVGPKEYAPYFENISIKESAKHLIAGFRFKDINRTMDSYKVETDWQSSQDEDRSMPERREG